MKLFYTTLPSTQIAYVWNSACLTKCEKNASSCPLGKVLTYKIFNLLSFIALKVIGSILKTIVNRHTKM